MEPSKQREDPFMKRKYFLLYLAAGLLVIAGLLSIVPGFKFSIILSLGFAALSVAGYFLLKHPKGKAVCKIILFCEPALELVLKAFNVPIVL